MPDKLPLNLGTPAATLLKSLRVLEKVIVEISSLKPQPETQKIGASIFHLLIRPLDLAWL